MYNETALNKNAGNNHIFLRVLFSSFEK